MKFSSMLVFNAVWVLLVYAPVAHWVWGGGFLGNDGVLDFAGGTVVHINAGVAGLVAALVIGKRLRYATEPFAPHSMVISVVGAALLWVGWFGFNAGSTTAVGGGDLGKIAFVTMLAAAGGAVSAMAISWTLFKKPDISMTLNGALAGLVGITAGADVMTPNTAVLIGLIAGAIVVFAVISIDRIKIDDPVGAISVHLVCGVWGTLAVGLFSSNPEHSFVTQLVGVLAYGAFTAVCAGGLFLGINAVMGLRVSPEEELEGLDLSEHGMHAYDVSQSSGPFEDAHLRRPSDPSGGAPAANLATDPQ